MRQNFDFDGPLTLTLHTTEWVAAQKLAYHWKAMAEARACPGDDQ